jgi:short-subunit dehydrogenase
MLLERQHKAAIILVNSQQGSIPAAGSLAFSSSSTFVGTFARGLNYELKRDKIDVLSFERGNLVNENDYLKQLSWTTTPTKAANACLQNVGLSTITYGPLLSEINVKLYTLMPLRFC